ncbi:MAG: hypothetical protein FWG25_11090, partial [Promicromonosporaceae bacterium]|nr:hypothetical protein [Promicromonosporaceae bacterium]
MSTAKGQSIATIGALSGANAGHSSPDHQHGGVGSHFKVLPLGQVVPLGATVSPLAFWQTNPGCVARNAEFTQVTPPAEPRMTGVIVAPAAFQFWFGSSFRTKSSASMYEVGDQFACVRLLAEIAVETLSWAVSVKVLPASIRSVTSRMNWLPTRVIVMPFVMTP